MSCTDIHVGMYISMVMTSILSFMPSIYLFSTQFYLDSQSAIYSSGLYYNGILYWWNLNYMYLSHCDNTAVPFLKIVTSGLLWAIRFYAIPGIISKKTTASGPKIVFIFVKFQCVFLTYLWYSVWCFFMINASIVMSYNKNMIYHAKTLAILQISYLIFSKTCLLQRWEPI